MHTKLLPILLLGSGLMLVPGSASAAQVTVVESYDASLGQLPEGVAVDESGFLAGVTITLPDR